GPGLTPTNRADIAREFEQAVVDVLAVKSLRALQSTGLRRLVVAGGVGANRTLRSRLLVDVTTRQGGHVFFPELAFCTDNGAMIALVGAYRLQDASPRDRSFAIRPRWDLASLSAPDELRAADAPLGAMHQAADILPVPPE